MKIIKWILKAIFVTLLLGLLAWIGKSLWNLWKNRGGR